MLPKFASVRSDRKDLAMKPLCLLFNICNATVQRSIRMRFEGNIASVLALNPNQYCFVGIRLGRFNSDGDGELDLGFEIACRRIYIFSILKLQYHDKSN